MGEKRTSHRPNYLTIILGYRISDTTVACVAAGSIVGRKWEMMIDNKQEPSQAVTSRSSAANIQSRKYIEVNGMRIWRAYGSSDRGLAEALYSDLAVQFFLGAVQVPKNKFHFANLGVCRMTSSPQNTDHLELWWGRWWCSTFSHWHVAQLLMHFCENLGHFWENLGGDR